MSVDGARTVLVLGGIRSGKSAYAESLVADAPSVRYVATAAGGQDDPEWLDRIEAHQRRRPQAWSTEETGADPVVLTEILIAAKPDDTLLVDDLGGWVAALLDPARQPNDDPATVAALADAVRACPGRLVLVSPEVGLSVVPATPLGRAFADAMGTANQALADACDAVALVVAGQPTWLKGAPRTTQRSAPPAAPPNGAVTPTADRVVAVPAPSGDGTGAVDEPTMVLPVVTPGTGEGADGAGHPVLAPDLDLPLPDADAREAAADRLAELDVPGAGLGALTGAVEFAAATQGTAPPRSWRSVRVLVVHGRHDGGAAAGAGPDDMPRRFADTGAGRGPLAALAARAGATLWLLHAAGSGALEDGPVLERAAVDQALGRGWDLAVGAADEGADLLVLAAFSAGAEAAAAAVVAATTGAEPAAILPRVVSARGDVDDAAWMRRCAAVRDGLQRIRHSPQGAQDLLAELGGGDIALATGIVLGAAARRLPVLVDGPVGLAAALLARDLASQAPHWCLLVDHGRQPTVRQAADVLGLDPVVDLRLDLGEGANALAVLPMLRTAIDAIASDLPGGGPAAEPGGTTGVGG